MYFFYPFIFERHKEAFGDCVIISYLFVSWFSGKHSCWRKEGSYDRFWCSLTYGHFGQFTSLGSTFLLLLLYRALFIVCLLPISHILGSLHLVRILFFCLFKILFYICMYDRSVWFLFYHDRWCFISYFVSSVSVLSVYSFRLPP